MRNKLYELGCTTPEVERQIADLIEIGLLNEERYAKAFARGKFNTLQWGKVKITYQLKAHQVSAYCIGKGLKEIDDNAYMATLHKLATKKWASLKAEKNQPTKKAKMYAYLLQKGYERDLVNDAINKLINSQN